MFNKISPNTDPRSTSWPSRQEGQDSDCMVVIPTYNERDNIRRLVREILFHTSYRVLIVDDNSPDGTGLEATKLSQDSHRVQVLIRQGRQGLGPAYVEGFQQALATGARFICQMDADFSHAPHDLPRLLAGVKNHWDMVLGSRYIHGGTTINWGVLRKVLSRAGNMYARFILGLGIRDCTSGFRCYHRKVLESIGLETIRSNGYSFQIEMLYRALALKFRAGEIPIAFFERHAGSSKMAKSIVLEALIMPWQMRLQGLPAPINTSTDKIAPLCASADHQSTIDGFNPTPRMKPAKRINLVRFQRNNLDL